MTTFWDSVGGRDEQVWQYWGQSYKHPEAWLNSIKSRYLISLLLFQDLEGGDIFAYYHPQDLPYLKQVYEAIMAEQVSVGILLFMIFRGQQSLIFLDHLHR